MKLLSALLGLAVYIAINRVDTRLFNDSPIKIFCQGLILWKNKKAILVELAGLAPATLGVNTRYLLYNTTAPQTPESQIHYSINFWNKKILI